jgi:DNA-binding CsgD family transcriptional regulator
MGSGVRDGKTSNEAMVRPNFPQDVSHASLEKEDIEHRLGERVKELTCLYGVSQLIAENKGTMEEILQRVADLLPPSWQYPEMTCGRVLFEGQVYATANFRTSEWKQAAAIEVMGKVVGAVEVSYLDEMVELDEGPFLTEERFLIDEIAAQVGLAAQRIRAEQLLHTEQEALMRSKIALQEVLTKVEEERREVGKRVQTNINDVIMPVLYALEARASVEESGYITLLKRHLKEIASPFSSELSKKFATLTPTELQLCNMIRNGLPSKEIACIRRVSPATVSRQRESIRRKLGVTNKDINLSTFLCTFGLAAR